MNPAEVLLELIEKGIVVWVDENRLFYRAPVGRLDGALRQRAALARPALIALVRSGAVLPATRDRWPADAIEDFEERAGILQFDGGFSQQEAEREAEQCVRLEHARAFIAHNALIVAPPAVAVAAGAGDGPHR